MNKSKSVLKYFVAMFAALAIGGASLTAFAEEGADKPGSSKEAKDAKKAKADAKAKAKAKKKAKKEEQDPAEDEMPEE